MEVELEVSVKYCFPIKAYRTTTPVYFVYVHAADPFMKHMYRYLKYNFSPIPAKASLASMKDKVSMLAVPSNK